MQDLAILEAMALQFIHYDKLTKIQMDGNFFNEEIAQIFLQMIQKAKHITTFSIPHTLSPNIIDSFQTVLKQRKPATTKKKTKKRKGKSKKKK